VIVAKQPPLWIAFRLLPVPELIPSWEI